MIDFTPIARACESLFKPNARRVNGYGAAQVVNAHLTERDKSR